MPPDLLRESVALRPPHIGRLEASGGITLANIRAVAETGVDYISIGAITHSASGRGFLAGTSQFVKAGNLSNEQNDKGNNPPVLRVSLGKNVPAVEPLRES